MALRRRPLFLTIVVVTVLAAALLSTAALGVDPLSLVIGAALAAASFALVVEVWLMPLRQDLRQLRRIQERDARQQARQTRRLIDAGERRLFSQLEALAWLREQLQLRRPLPPTRAAAAAPDALLELVRIIDRSGARQVVELGSGVSTIVIARRLQQAGAGRVIALEHLPRYAELTRAEIVAQGLEAHATVLDAPLVDVTIGDGEWRWYELGPDVPTRIEALFIDGPPKSTGPLARYPALSLLRDRLVSGATVFLDDGDRPDEREMVRRWQAEIEGLQVRELPLTKGAWLMTMPQSGHPD